LLKISKTEAIKLYGLPLINFIKYESQSDAYFALLESVQRIFNYSDGFIYRVKKQFPKPLNKHEKAYISLFNSKFELIEDIKNLLYNENLSISNYDVEKEEFILFEFSEYHDDEFHYDCGYQGEFVFTLKGKENKRGFSCQKEFIEKANILIKLDKKISYIQSNWHDINITKLGTKGHLKLLKHSIPTYYFPKLSSTIHCLIKECQKSLKQTLMSLLDRDNIKRNKTVLSVFIRTYNTFKPILIVNDNGTINKASPNFPESAFIINEVFYSGGGAVPETMILEFPAFYAISFFLINFLMLPNSTNLINQCHECDDIYIEIKKTKNRRFCSTNCRQKYHNRKRIESGEAKEYKRRKRKEGARASYYG